MVAVAFLLVKVAVERLGVRSEAELYEVGPVKEVRVLGSAG